MLTPNFRLEQTSEELIVEIHAPYANVRDAEIEYFDSQFLFSANPYFLRLYLPGEICDSEHSSSGGSATYDCDNGKFTIRIRKKERGHHFPNLDMINELLKPSKVDAKPLVEEISEQISNDDLSNDCLAEQHITTFPATEDICSPCGYGFAWKRHGVIEKIALDIGKFIDLNNPDDTPIDQRCELCKKFDEENFNAEHYVADLFDACVEIDSCLKYILPEDCFELTFESRDRLKDLPKRIHSSLSTEMHKAIALSLIDLFFAYLYDLRITESEHSVESGWTLVKLSATLSFMVRWKNAQQAIIASVRRSLCYALYRNWQLSMTVLDDLKQLLKKDRAKLLQCLVDMRTILSTSGEHRYLLNDLYLTDYCLWIQSTPDEIIEWLANEVKEVSIDKKDVDLDLEQIELLAQFQMLNCSASAEADVDSDDD